MRNNLRKVRKDKKLKQVEVAKYLNISLVQYQRIEYGIRNTTTDNWDKLEDLFKVPQRQLRENTNIRKEDKDEPINKCKYQK